MESKPAGVVVFHHIGPYHYARVNAAADRLSVTSFEWSAKACDAWGTADLPARYIKFLSSRKQQTGSRAPALEQAMGAGCERSNHVGTTDDRIAIIGGDISVRPRSGTFPGSELQNCGGLWTGLVWRRVGGCNCNGHQRHAKETWNNR